MIKENFKLSDGRKIPAIAFGTYLTGGTEKNIHEIAIEEGYRFFDTASLYGTERSLGEALKNSGLKREEFIIQSKLWHDERGYKGTKEALSRSLERLGLDYLDIYLIHWPRAPKEDKNQWMQTNIDTCKALIELKEQGLIRGFGFSNFLPHHIKPLIDVDKSFTPLVDQLELHIGYSQPSAVDYCHKNNILPQAWSPLARGKMDTSLGSDIISSMTAKYDKSETQIFLRYLIEKGIMPIVKASSPEHMRANMQIFDFRLEFEDLSMLDCYPYNTWLGEHPDLSIPAKTSDFTV